MNEGGQNQNRLLAVALSTHGLGFAVLEGEKFLVENGNMSVKRDKNQKCLSKVEELIALYVPDQLVLQELAANYSARAPRIKVLHEAIMEVATRYRLKVTLISNRELRHALFVHGSGTKHEMAQLLADRFRDELALRLPPKRQPWESADERMDIFAAAGLAVVLRIIEMGIPASGSDKNGS